MAFVRNRILNVICQYAISGNRLSTKMAYGVDSPLVPEDTADLCADWITQVLGIWKLAVSQDVRFQALYAYCDAPETVPPFQQPFTDENGLLAFDSLPSNIPAVMQLRQTEIVGRHNGRMFISGVSENDVTDSLITNAAIAAHWEDLVDKLLMPLTLSGGRLAKLCVVLRQSGGAPVTPQGLLVVQTVLTKNLASQRRRTTELREFHA